MALLEPKFAILDETDSGLDIDALKIVSGGQRADWPNRSFIIITHYQAYSVHHTRLRACAVQRPDHRVWRPGTGASPGGGRL
jgi:Fe-S cluster assembly ATPase SufC